MQAKKLVFLEFNELCPSLLARWMGQGVLPSFKKFHDDSQVFTGTADAREQEFLEPWIQWYSQHTGLDYYTHNVFHLTDGPAAPYTDIWHSLLDGGLSVGNFAGMNAGKLSGRGSFYMPDPWCMTEAPFPAELAAFHSFIAAKVQESSNATARLDRGAYVAFVRFLVSHGLSLESIAAIVRQLASEAMGRPIGWKRAALLDQLQADIFLHYWKRAKPDFASIFMNSTAHFQHAYFHAIDDPDSDATHRDAVLFGYQSMDRFLGRFFAELEPAGAMLVLTSALSQQSNPDGGSKYYRLRDAAALFERLGIVAKALLPVMSHQYSAVFADAAAAEDARRRLAQVTCGGRQVFQFGSSPEDTLFFDNGFRSTMAQDATVVITEGSQVENFGYFDLFYLIPHTKSGIHHPDSVIWLKTGIHHVHPDRVSILDVFPTVRDYYGVDDAPRDGLARKGSSLLPSLGIGRYRADFAVAAE